MNIPNGVSSTTKLVVRGAIIIEKIIKKSVRSILNNVNEICLDIYDINYKFLLTWS